MFGAERVAVLDQAFAWNGETYGSLSQVAKAMTGTSWNGHRFFGLRTARFDRSSMVPRGSGVCDAPSPDAASTTIEDRGAAFADDLAGRRRRHEIGARQNDAALAIYTRVSTEQDLEQEFNSLDNRREASEA